MSVAASAPTTLWPGAGTTGLINTAPALFTSMSIFSNSRMVFSAILYTVNPAHNMPPMFHLLAGGLMLGAIYMATDMVTTPVTRPGMIVFGVGCGVLTMLIRKWGGYPEGVSFSILLMNAVAPLINRATRPRVFGTTRKKKR